MDEKNILQLQKYIRGYVCRQQLRRLKDRMTLSLIQKLLNEYILYYRTVCELNTSLLHKKIRHVNFPSEISENIVKFVFYKKYNIMPTWDTCVGDLQFGIGDSIISLEIKAFSSKGPTSFGPHERWDILYFLDATLFTELRFNVYECRLSNTHPKWRQLKVNQRETYEDHCRQQRRPRLCFSEIQKQLGDDCQLIFKGILEKNEMINQLHNA